ncbi:CD244 protein, partial [Sula dactylatra]|nr:CD244 protein [Sula dactylatra]
STSGSPQCREQAVPANGTLRLLPENPPQGWAKVEWRVVLDAGHQWRILTAEKNKVASPSRGPFSGRAVFQQKTLSLWIGVVGTADSGVYRADFEDTSGVVTSLCFRVSVWEPVHPPRLEARILHQEQGWCNLSLLCTVPGAGNVSYRWFCTGEAPGALEHQPWLHLQVYGDAEPNACSCNVSNPVSWGTASTDAAAACRRAASGLLVVAVSLGLALVISVAVGVICYCWRKRGKDLPGGHIELPLTIYEEVHKAQTIQDPNGTSEATTGGNTIYAVICPKTQGPSHRQEPESRTIYTTVQPTRKVRLPCRDPGPSEAAQEPGSPRKRLDRALVSTAYAEV